MGKYKWAHPYEWLMWKATSWDLSELFDALQAVAVKHDSDTLQDIFQFEMDKDGYFEEKEETSP